MNNFYIDDETGGARLKAALRVDGGKVHVIFCKTDWDCVGFFMDRSVYRAIDRTYGTPVVYDYAAIGTLEPAPCDFY